jgi:hypothetical protein
LFSNGPPQLLSHQNRIYDAENRGVGADAERQGQNRNRRKGGILAQ